MHVHVPYKKWYSTSVCYFAYLSATYEESPSPCAWNKELKFAYKNGGNLSWYIFRGRMQNLKHFFLYAIKLLLITHNTTAYIYKEMKKKKSQLQRVIPIRGGAD